MRFKDRTEAAELLLKALEHYKGTNPLVLGIPRGAIPMARMIAEGLKGELGAILVHKIPAPYNEEFAIGSIGLSGKPQYLPYADSLNISESYLEAAAKVQLNVLKARQKNYGLSEPNYKDRIVIIVDDGIATGATVLSAIEEIRQFKPKKVIVAAPVSSIDSADKIRSLADEVTILYEPQEFYAVGQFYDNFSQVSDDEVIQILKKTKF